MSDCVICQRPIRLIERSVAFQGERAHPDCATKRREFDAERLAIQAGDRSRSLYTGFYADWLWGVPPERRP